MSKWSFSRDSGRTTLIISILASASSGEDEDAVRVLMPIPLVIKRQRGMTFSSISS